MHFSRCWPQLNRRQCARSGGLLLVAVVYGWLATGVPLPKPLPSVAERFPCENCPCGCRTAEQCWQNCCCYSLEQRLAWAERNGVRPPKWVVERATESTTKSCCCCASGCKAKEPDADTDPTPLCGWMALRCQGKTAQWLLAAPTVLPQPFCLLFPEKPAASPRPVSSLLISGWSAPPPVPPPEHDNLA